MRLFHSLRAAALALLACAALPASATVDDAHSFAMEAAMPFVEQGFIVREEYWNGEVKSGQKLMIKHQMFKGNEYAFWLGTANEETAFELKVYDEKGKLWRVGNIIATPDELLQRAEKYRRKAA